MSEFAIELLRDLVAIDSVNPSLVPGGAGETEIANALAAEMRRIDLDVEITEPVSGRPNVVGVLEGRAPGRSLMLCGHMDTVGVIGMDAPFDPVQRDGRLYGRGAQDMKGGLAAMLGAARTITTSGGTYLASNPGRNAGAVSITGSTVSVVPLPDQPAELP